MAQLSGDPHRAAGSDPRAVVARDLWEVVDREDPAAVLRLGQRFDQRGEIADAQYIYERLFEQGYAEAGMALAELLERRGDRRGAELVRDRAADFRVTTARKRYKAGSPPEPDFVGESPASEFEPVAGATEEPVDTAGSAHELVDEPPAGFEAVAQTPVSDTEEATRPAAPPDTTPGAPAIEPFSLSARAISTCPPQTMPWGSHRWWRVSARC